MRAREASDRKMLLFRDLAFRQSKSFFAILITLKILFLKKMGVSEASDCKIFQRHKKRSDLIYIIVWMDK